MDTKDNGEKGNVLEFPKGGAGGGCPIPLPQPFMDAWNDFAETISKAVDKASHAGLPPQLVLGQLEATKADVLDMMFAAAVEMGMPE